MKKRLVAVAAAAAIAALAVLGSAASAQAGTSLDQRPRYGTSLDQ
jgi:hypothetical protein